MNSSELRKDPFSDGWVIISPDRNFKPSDFKVEEIKPEINSYETKCPFCPGNEGETSVEIRALGRNDTENISEWAIRVVANRFPALKIENKLSFDNLNKVHNRIGGMGAHEVIIESPEHNLEFHTFSNEKRKEILEVFRERIEDLYKDYRFAYVQLFRNFGKDAGASLVHPHSQIIAVPTIPKRGMEEIKASENFWKTYSECIFCAKINNNENFQERVILENDEFIAFVPYAARFAFETWIMPKKHSSEFQNCNPKELKELSEIMGKTQTAIAECLNNPPYNLVLHTSPNLENKYLENIQEYFHWHFEIIPRITSIAGFEWGTGFYINPISPEKSAKMLREFI
ncbi:MAG: galactose-1-phosphate uridylyltransferase [Calditrichaeota bacterium]|nr:MAG: galactose-1-phosphate uridylyltransferase [Calditrichota bacterium]